jgi:cysteine desulfurase
VTYFDHNASSPLLPVARTAWLDAEERFPGNPSSQHRIGARAERALDDARQRLARLLACAPEDVIWTSGATEACNTALQHAIASSPPHAELWVSAIEHPAVLATARTRVQERLRLIPVDAQGRVELEWVRENLPRARPALVAVMAANNETGVLQPWSEARELCAEHGVPYFCDATQWFGRLPGRRLGAAGFVAGSAHKFGGPRGVGFLACPPGSACRALLHGGGQQDGRRAGTENVAGVLALVAALEWSEQQLAAGGDRERREIRDRFERQLLAAVAGGRVNGAGADRLWNTSSVVLPAADCRQRLVVKLDKAGFAVSTGSACASGSERPSHVLTAMGLTAADASRAVRFSAGWLTPAEAWDELLAAIVRIQGETTASSAAATALQAPP